METATKHLLLFGGGGIEKFTGGDNAFLDEFNYPQIDRENLLKAPDDLTNTTYWSNVTNLTITDQGDGVSRLDKTGGGAHGSYVHHHMLNWFPGWAGEVSVVLEVRAGTINEIDLTIVDDGGNALDAVEKISGSGSAALVGSRLVMTGLDSGWSKFRGSGSVKGWSTTLRLPTWPDAGNSNTGWLEVRNFQVILGDQPSEKPRPVAQETAYPMMAYRPNWRLTKDGSARALVVDTEGLEWCGEATDIKIAPATGTAITANANCRLVGRVTCEDTKYVDVMIRYTDASNWVKLRIHTDRQVQLIKNVAGTPTTVDTGSTLTDAELYRYELVADGSSVKAYIDDKLEVEGTITDHQAVAQARVEHDLASNDLRVVAESNPKASGLIIAGGKTTPAYGDPGMWHTKPDGSAFAVGASSAMLVTAKTWVAAKDATFGFDSNTAGALVEPRLLLTSDELNADTAGGNETPQAWAAGAEMSFMQLLRSDTHGSHFLIHESGKQWKLFNANAGAIPAASAYPAISNYDAALSLTRIALLDLSSWVERDFAEVTDSKSAPAHNSAFDCDADFHLRSTFTYESSGSEYVIWSVRFADINNRIYLRAVTTTGALQIVSVVGGTPDTLFNSAGVFSDGVNHQLDVVGEGSSFKVYVDNVLKLDTTETDNQTNAGGYIQRVLTVNDIELSTHPAPALGLATSRIIAPQDSDTADCPSDNAVYIRNLTLASSGSAVYLDRRYKDFDNSHFIQLVDDGRCYDWKIVEGASAQMWVMAIGVVQDGDTILATLDGVKSEGFLNGVSAGSSVLAGHLNETGAVFSSDRDFVCDALEFWPLYHNLPFRL